MNYTCLELQRGQEKGKKKETKTTLIIKYRKGRMESATTNGVSWNVIL